MKKKVLITATVQSHICQFHKPLAKVLHKLGYEVHVAARDNLAEKNGLKLDFVDKVYDIPFSRSPLSKDNYRAYKDLHRIIEINNYSVIHCNTPVGGIVTRLAAINKRKKGCKVVYTAHGFHFYKGASIMNWLIYYPIERLFALITDVLITINVEDYMLAKSKFKTMVMHIHGVGVDSKRFTSVDDNSRRQLRKEMGYADYEFIILCVGELLQNKNQNMAIKTMVEIKKKYPKSILIIAGNGPEKEKLEKKIHELDLNENVKLIGYCTNIENYQKISDVLVACSRREGLGLNVIEALLSGNPVIAAKNRGHNELIIDQKNGYLVEQDDYLRMASCVLELLHSNDKRTVFSDYAIKSANNYTFERVENELEKIYKQLV